MTLSGPFLKTLLMAASIGMVVPVRAQSARPGPRQVHGQDAEEAAQVVGVERAWAGGILGLAIEGNAFVLRFYDADKKPVPVAVARAAVRWDPVGRSGTDRTVMNPVGDSLRSPSVVRPPHLFIAWVTLLNEEGKAIGIHAFDMRELRGK